MSAIISSAGQTGQTLYAIIRDSSGQAWNGAAFEAFLVGNWSSYDVALTEQTMSGFYSAAFPSAIAAGNYSFVVHQQLGGSPAAGDPVWDRGRIEWNGTTEDLGAESALIAYKLDKFILTSPASAKPTIGSYLDQLMSKNSGQTFDPATDSLEAIKDSGAGPTASELAQAVWDELMSSHVVSGSAGEYLSSIFAALPSGVISSFDPTVQNVNLNANQSGVTIGTVNALGSTALAQINSEIVDVLFVDTIPELTVIPGSTPTMAKALMLLFMALRNKRTASTSQEKLYNNAGTVIATADISDDSTTATKEQFA